MPKEAAVDVRAICAPVQIYAAAVQSQFGGRIPAAASTLKSGAPRESDIKFCHVRCENRVYTKAWNFQAH